ncbi:RNA polymerase sigma factor [Phaeodactylibacter luteus]|uniref:RNA polymerase sigma factor n=2 Tax=Phaeodactylibacter luteus TaxID=1564516 RepID=A0A5C6RMN5_9BACT|nr:RNA polymerase sigma factor [Phaeodactylibacter luteus]
MINFNSLTNKDALAGWLFRIARNHCIDILRQKRRNRDVALESSAHLLLHQLSVQQGDGFVPDAVEIERKVVEGLSRLEKLAPLDFKILLMKYREDLTIKEIASDLKIREGAVKMRIHRAKHRAQSLLKEKA